ncbi:MAG: pkn1 [Myxococcales bacterium]|nr:pkn1 [Myxococcales bacterium]
MVALRVTVRVADLDAFITRYSRHIVGDRIFIFSKSQQPIGTTVRFHLQLPDGEALLSGRGTVTRVQAEGGDARHPPGMELKFEPLDERSRTLVDFMLATRAGMTADVIADAPPIVRAVVPLPPAPRPPAPKLPPAAPRALSSPPGSLLPPPKLPPPPPAIPLGSSPSLPPDEAAAGSSPPLPALAVAVLAVPAEAAPPPVTAKPVPVARPPSVSLEVGWKEEAGEVPANPFSEVSDNAIEYFVEWSFEQSIGPRATPQAQFSDVPMALPGKNAHPLLDPAARRIVLLVGGGLFAAGLLFGGVTVAMLRHTPRARSSAATPTAPVAAAAPLASPSPPAPAATPSPPAVRNAELIVRTRPPRAAVTIDGEPAGLSPLTTHLTPGEHAISVGKDRYATASSTVEAPGKLDVDLRRPPATLHVTSTPPAADVVIAGQRRGRTPLDVKLAGFESYDVRVVLAGTKPWRKTVYLGRAMNRVDAVLPAVKRR